MLVVIIEKLKDLKLLLLDILPILLEYRQNHTCICTNFAETFSFFEDEIINFFNIIRSSEF